MTKEDQALKALAEDCLDGDWLSDDKYIRLAHGFLRLLAQEEAITASATIDLAAIEERIGIAQACFGADFEQGLGTDDGLTVGEMWCQRDREALHRYVRFLLAQEEAKLELARGWQPIATVPKDGREVLVCTTAKWVRVAWWQQDYARWLSAGHAVKPTHWQPLPQPPETSA